MRELKREEAEARQAAYRKKNESELDNNDSGLAEV
jgi:hypothetical protein